MPQVSLYVDDASMTQLRKDAAVQGVSLSKYVAGRLSEEGRASTPSGMPPGHFERLYGCIDDDTFARPEQLGYDLDAPRIAFP